MKAAMKAMKKRAAMKAPTVMKKRASMKASKVMKKQAAMKAMRVTEETAAMKDMPVTEEKAVQCPSPLTEFEAALIRLDTTKGVQCPSPMTEFEAELVALDTEKGVQTEEGGHETAMKADEMMKKNAAKKADKNVMKKKAAMKAMKAMRAQRTRHKLDIKKMEAAKKAMEDCIAVIQGAFKNVVEARAHHVLPPEIEQYLNRSTNYLSMAAATIIGLPW